MPNSQSIEVDGHELRLSNLEKVYYPDNGFSKGEVLAYYTEAAEFILPHLHDRPQTLKRYPDGIEAGFFYEKNAPKHTPDWVKTVAVPRSEGGEPIHYVLCNDRATLLWVTNLGDIEKHVFLARVPKLDRPTAMVFDLDPGAPADILDCGRVALELKKVFDGLGLQSFVKVSGSKGLHLSVPLNTATTYEQTQPFAKAIAELMEQRLPDCVVSAMAKSIRKDRILIDWSQNSEHKTTVCVYAMRAKPGGPFISMPVDWDELQRAVKRGKPDPLFFTPAQALKRLAKKGDLFAPVLELKQSLPESFTEALTSGPPIELSRWPGNNRTSTKTRDHSIREYAAKRDPARTPEPMAAKKAPKAKPGGPLRFVVQKHAASQLHYDFRLEMEGVLRSWAVPKGPPREPKEARLAMHVEDHPLDYADFEGTIPKGNYGAGTVMVWDQGEYEDLSGNPTAAFHEGKLHLKLRGKKLKGEWVLLRDKRDDEGSKWLLIKAGKALRLSAKADDTSAVTGRSMAAIAEANDRQWKSDREPDEPKPARKRRKGSAYATR